uniref:Uncharacterized protein n=1 Tax=Arion vulgaris TaxID=1028688 RepID=A0A0B7BPV3_9EUPU
MKQKRPNLFISLTVGNISAAMVIQLWLSNKEGVIKFKELHSHTQNGINDTLFLRYRRD